MVIGIFLLALLGSILFWVVWRYYDAQLLEIDHAIEQINRR